jgi:transposase-like protein
MSIPTQKKFSALFPDEITAVRFLSERGVFYQELNCSQCGTAMKKYHNPDAFMCTRRSCAKRGSRLSLRTGTFFCNSHLSCLDILNLAHLWLCEIPVKSCITYTGYSPNTVCAYFKHFRQLVTSALQEEDTVIGGEGIIVEVDETKLGKRKYHRGHRVDGVWVVVGIERVDNGKIFLIPVQDRSAETLEGIIENHVRVGSTVHTDMWRAYSNIDELGLTHVTVNHSQHFLDPVTGGCTNRAEGLNSGLKRKIPVRNRTGSGIEFHLGEYIWRRQCKDKLFDSFIEALRDMHYDLE